jgi:hypothetical protein
LAQKHRKLVERAEDQEVALPSPLKSASAIWPGEEPPGAIQGVTVVNVPSPLPSRTDGPVAEYEILLAVAIQVGADDLSAAGERWRRE